MSILTTTGISRFLYSSANILVIEDDLTMADALQTVLTQEGYTVTLAATGPEGLRKLTNGNNYDLLLLDVMLPEIDGWTILSRLRAAPATARIPVIMLTAMAGEQNEVELLTAGADDYIAKPFSFENLVAHINALLRRSALQSINPLTGLPGNRQVERFLKQCVKETLHFWAAAYADIDNFKAYNDAYGFLQGDEVLKATAEVIAGAGRLSSQDVFVGNIGGDDFFMGFNKNVPRLDAAAAEEVGVVLANVAAEFDATSKKFYSAADIERGYLEAESRRGGVERYPLMSLSIAVVTNAKRLFNHPLEISNVFASVKRKAKAQLGSVVCFDQRKR